MSAGRSTPHHRWASPDDEPDPVSRSLFDQLDDDDLPDPRRGEALRAKVEEIVGRKSGSDCSPGGLGENVFDPVPIQAENARNVGALQVTQATIDARHLNEVQLMQIQKLERLAQQKIWAPLERAGLQDEIQVAGIAPVPTGAIYRPPSREGLPGWVLTSASTDPARTEKQEHIITRSALKKLHRLQAAGLSRDLEIFVAHEVPDRRVGEIIARDGAIPAEFVVAPVPATTRRMMERLTRHARKLALIAAAPAAFVVAVALLVGAAVGVGLLAAGIAAALSAILALLVGIILAAGTLFVAATAVSAVATSDPVLLGVLRLSGDESTDAPALWIELTRWDW